MPDARSQGTEPSLSLRFIDPTHNEPKKMRAHKKSRGGCGACKKRKVKVRSLLVLCEPVRLLTNPKCDEQTPCSNCIRLNETCEAAHKSSATPEQEASPASSRPPDLSGPVNLVHLELFHHFQHVTVPTLCFSEEEYLMTAMLATSARHLSVLRPDEPVYDEAALTLLSRSCAGFSAALNQEDGREKHNPLFFTAMLIHYLTWCNLDFLEDEGKPADGRRLDLKGDQLFLLSSGVRVFLSSTRAQGPDSIFANMASISQCSALETIVASQGMDCDGIVTDFMRRYDELSTSQTELSTQTRKEREAYQAIVTRLSVILALWRHREANPSPPQRADLERYILSFPLFCVGIFLEMVVGSDTRALLVLYHFYRTSRLLLGTEESWWASRRLNTMEASIKLELERRRISVAVRDFE
ncbi:C6 transcription factor [Colletotrichum kahawae]|uniref:C6 transcription factor n=1 Tax=Colletotrichum kahawae TaxID=34407 RepID=A0AAE0DBC0_COLKA|nr:C6 transcription factor [Colletotrichum kahawae]